MSYNKEIFNGQRLEDGTMQSYRVLQINLFLKMTQSSFVRYAEIINIMNLGMDVPAIQTDANSQLEERYEKIS